MNVLSDYYIVKMSKKLTNLIFTIIKSGISSVKQEENNL